MFQNITVFEFYQKFNFSKMFDKQLFLAEHISSRGWNAVVGTNLYGTWNCMQEAFDQHMKDNGGRIVNIVTTNKTGMAGMSHTSSARAGVKTEVL
jgi:NAD(P)-dependent dehydrogenase (short-subunit alcohol dehydrogenase family)